MPKLMLILALFMPHFASAIGPLWGPSPNDYTDYECLPPIAVSSFDAHLNGGTLDGAIPWSVVAAAKVDSSSRLIFQQMVSFEFVLGKFVSVQDQDEMEEQKAHAMTGTRYTLDLLKNAPLPSPREVSPFMRNLVAMSQKSNHLFRVQSLDFEGVKSRHFANLVRPGALVFSQEQGAVVLSSDHTNLSICAKVDAYRDTESHQEWLAITASDFEVRKLAAIVHRFINDPEVNGLLKCDELLVSRASRP